MSEFELKAINEKIKNPLGRLYLKENSVYSSPLLDRLIWNGFHVGRKDLHSTERYLFTPSRKQIISASSRVDLLMQLAESNISTLLKTKS